MKILCVIVLYYPNWDLVRRNLLLMSPYLDKIILWDNTPNPATMKEFDGVKLFSKGENIGLSRAYNEAWKIASTNSYDYLMTMDQDSQWDGFPTYIKMVKEYENTASTKQRTLYFISSEQEKHSYIPIFCGGINSGAIIPISVLNESAGYNTDFFVDVVDDWLIAEAQKKGYNCIKIGGPRIIQKYGNPKLVKVLGKQFITNNYSAMRIYGIIRNYLILFHNYNVPVYFRKHITAYIIKMPIIILLAEKNKWIKMKAIFYGIYDGLTKHSSRIKKFM